MLEVYQRNFNDASHSYVNKDVFTSKEYKYNVSVWVYM